MKSAKELIIYKDFKNGRLFYNFTWILENYKNDYYNKEDIRALFYAFMICWSLREATGLRETSGTIS